MSRIGKLPIAIPEGVKVQITDNKVIVEGKQGKLEQGYEKEWVSIELTDGKILVKRHGDDKSFKARHGLYRSLIANMIKGVQEPYAKTLVLRGLGYRAKVQGKELVLEVGFTKPVKYQLPEGITCEVANQEEITVKGADKQLVGQVAAKIRSFRKPEPYKGTGIRYKDEQIKIKEGKLGAAAEKAAG